MWIRQIITATFGLGAGVITATGVIALITSIGMVPRLAGKTHTARNVRTYETCIMLGATLGNLFYLTRVKLNIGGVIGIIVLIIYGLFTGIFVGCLATSLAETINSTSVFARRFKLVKGLGIIVFITALSKMIGSILQFMQRWGSG